MRLHVSEETIKAFLAEKRLSQRQRSQLQLLDRSRDAEIRHLDTVTSNLRSELESMCRNMTNTGEYFTTKVQQDDDDECIIFPLIRTKTDWDPRPCCLGNAAVNQNRCFHFPCRNFTSYHFIFRPLPKFILDNADLSVRKSKETSSADIVDTPSERQTTHERNELKLPAIDMPYGISDKERKLKTVIRMKRQRNEIENKPADRNVNYGKPTSIRRLRKPARPAMRDVDLK